MEWRTHPDFPHHEVSETGLMRRKVRVGNHLPGKVLRGDIIHTGYLRYKVMANGVKRSAFAHRLVCELWHGLAPSPIHQAAHNDGVKSNNHFTNLRWATPKENSADRHAHGTMPSGEGHYNSKLTARQVMEIRSACTGKYGQITAMARRLGVSPSCVGHALHGLNWKGK